VTDAPHNTSPKPNATAKHDTPPPEGRPGDASEAHEPITFEASRSLRRKVVIWGVLAFLLALGCAWFNTPITWALAVPNLLLALAMLVLYVGVLRDSAIFQYRDGVLEMGGGPFAEHFIDLDAVDAIDRNDTTGLVTLHGERLDESVTLPITVLDDADAQRLLALIGRHI